MTDTAPRAQILLATDGSDHADHALRLADRWARASELRLTVVHVLQVAQPVSPLFPIALGTEIDAMQEMRSQITATIRQKIEAITGRNEEQYTLLLPAGTPYVEIVRLAEQENTSLIVLGARGHSGLLRVFLGHTAEKVARHAHCPVFVARPGPHSKKVLVATDLSDVAAVAVKAAAAYARTHQSALSALYVADTMVPFPLDAGSGVDVTLSMRDVIKNRGMTQLESHLADLGVRATPIVAEPPIADAIADTAEAMDADLVVVGTHGRTGLRRIALGSAAGEALESVHCSVLVIRAEDHKS